MCVLTTPITAFQTAASAGHRTLPMPKVLYFCRYHRINGSKTSHRILYQPAIFAALYTNFHLWSNQIGTLIVENGAFSRNESNLRRIQNRYLHKCHCFTPLKVKIYRQNQSRQHSSNPTKVPNSTNLTAQQKMVAKNPFIILRNIKF